jgi:seryl-tRNA synthetase
MIDLKMLREDSERIRKGIARKKFQCDLDRIIELDQKRRAIITESEQLRAQQKSANAEMAAMQKGSPEFLDKIGQLKVLSASVKALQERQQEAEAAWQEGVMTIPNIPHASVPDGDDESGNVVIREGGPPDRVFPDARPHFDIPWFSELADFSGGARVTGAGFPFFLGDLARLVRALIDFFLEEARGSGYVEILAPLLVNRDSALATGQLPDKEGQMYEIPSEGLFLIPTAEVPITNLYRGAVLEGSDLPLKHCGHTPCFRREAGSYGKDVRGLNRLHQFDKVELVQWVYPDSSFDALEGLLEDSERLLRKLRLPYRVLLMCAGDIGFPHAKQYDIDVWAAGQKRWLEVSSCSNFTDFQARRADIRFRDEGGKLRHVHTLNGSALAIPRTLAAILENNLRADGLVEIPEVLRSRMGVETIGRVAKV